MYHFNVVVDDRYAIYTELHKNPVEYKRPYLSTNILYLLCSRSKVAVFVKQYTPPVGVLSFC